MSRSTVERHGRALLEVALLAVALFGVACSPDARTPQQAQVESTGTGRVVVGVGVRDVQPIDLQRSGGTDLRGAYVGQVLPGSPAERVGIRIGDVVVSANQAPIVRAEDLQRMISDSAGGQTHSCFRDSAPGVRSHWLRSNGSQLRSQVVRAVSCCCFKMRGIRSAATLSRLPQERSYEQRRCNYLHRRADHFDDTH